MALPLAAALVTQVRMLAAWLTCEQVGSDLEDLGCKVKHNDAHHCAAVLLMKGRQPKARLHVPVTFELCRVSSHVLTMAHASHADDARVGHTRWCA